ncbi:unnamed protein product [Phytophthora fragariaefolia]|uniref:Unnamed protein product n=1 Tax=Phytophthora fragariaefolia TaxID=1490495 RepID=A0A9W6XLQ1_9STRA|nr:unnamed protein product [Phytophthora fragariaefolia]
MATVMECIPLKHPEAGWRANYAFWIRLFVSLLPISFGAVFQVIAVIDPGVISPSGIIVTAVGSCTGCVALTMGLAASWKFPVPFGYVFCVPPSVIIYMILFVLSIGPKVLAQSPVMCHQLFSQLLVVAAQAVLAIAYPLYSAVSNQLTDIQQSAFIFVLPIIKFCIKQVIVKMASHLGECIGLIVVFSVDVCNVVYVAVCMQTAISPLTSTLMLVSDAIFVLIALRSIYYHAEAAQTWKKSSTGMLENDFFQDLKELIREAFRYANKPNALPVPIRVRSPITLPLSVESARFISELVHSKRRNAGEAQPLSNLATYPSLGRESKRGGIQPKPRCFDVINENSLKHGHKRILSTLHGSEIKIEGPDHFLAISRKALPQVNFEEVVRASSRSTVTAPTHHSVAVADAQDALQMLFHSEYVIMAEYVECAIPILYGVYLSCLYHLPTAAFYPHTRAMTPEKFIHTQVNFMVYALVECASFIGLSMLLQRKLGFSPLYQLAFVLETQVSILQGHFFLWVSWILQITLVHNGKTIEGGCHSVGKC